MCVWKEWKRERRECGKEKRMMNNGGWEREKGKKKREPEGNEKWEMNGKELLERKANR